MGWWKTQIAKEAYSKGNNITHALKGKTPAPNTPEIVALAHDLQAGRMPTYPSEIIDGRAEEIALAINDYVMEDSTLLDVGTGEMLMLDLIMYKLQYPCREVFASDLSWSRLHNATMEATKLVCDNVEIPLPTKSIDIVMCDNVMMYEQETRVTDVIQELFRVSKGYVVFVEPSYEHSTAEGRKRMLEHSYLHEHILKLNIESLYGEIVHSILIKNNYKDVMPNQIWVVKVPETNDISNWPEVTVPGTDYPLDGNLFSKDLLVSFPRIDGIPILLNDKAVVTAARNV